jgi:hypothetical protein
VTEREALAQIEIRDLRIRMLERERELIRLALGLSADLVDPDLASEVEAELRRLEESANAGWRAARCGAEEVARAVALLRVAAATATSTIGPTFALGTRQAYGAAADLLQRGSCDRAPQGWVCSREPDHDGPCAAHEIPPGSLVDGGTE